MVYAPCGKIMQVGRFVQCSKWVVILDTNLRVQSNGGIKLTGEEVQLLQEKMSHNIFLDRFTHFVTEDEGDQHFVK